MKTVALGDVCQVTTGQPAPQGPDAFGQDGVPFVRAGSLERLCAGDPENSLERISPENARKYRLKVFPADTVVFPKSGMSAKLGRIYRLRRDCHLVSHLAAVLPSKQVSAAYLHRWFEHSPPSKLIENDAYPSIKTSTLDTLQIPLPALSEQRRIAAILDKADALRAKRRGVIAQLDRLLQSVFLDMFGDPQTNSKNWPLLALADAAFFQEGPGILAKDFRADGVPLVRMAGLREGKVTLKGCNYVDPEMHARRWSHFSLSKGDILVMTSASFGNPSVVDIDAVGAIFYTGIIRFRSKRDDLLSDFLRRFLASPWFMRQARVLATGATIKHFGPTHLKLMEIPLPPLAAQQRFVDIAAKIEFEKRAIQNSAEMHDTLFVSLQSRAFTGNL